MTPHVLVAYASKRGATAEIAEDIGTTLRSNGCTVDVRPVGSVVDITPYTGVVIGSGLYAGHWLRDARRFVARFADQLCQRPVWMFSSGPLEARADHSVPPTRSVEAIMGRIRARAHATFGGRLAPDATGFIASRIARKYAGDWRNWGLIRQWANHVATELASAPDVPPRTVPPLRTGGGILATLCLFVGVAAIAGGISLLLWPDGSALRLSTDLLEHSPFTSYSIPGLLLLLVGIGHLIAGGLVIGDARRADNVAFVAGGALLVWLVVQMSVLRTGNWQQLAMLVIALAIIAQALRRHAKLAT
jgi:menaquinone-dependent protoporphyrinogen oxidase